MDTWDKSKGENTDHESSLTLNGNCGLLDFLSILNPNLTLRVRPWELVYDGNWLEVRRRSTSASVITHVSKFNMELQLQSAEGCYQRELKGPN